MCCAAAARTRTVELVVGLPVPAAEDHRPAVTGSVEKAHAPIAGAQTVRFASDVPVIFVALRVGLRVVVAAAQRFGRRHHPRRLAGRVGKAIDIDVCSAGEAHGPLPVAAIAGNRGVFAAEGAVGPRCQTEHLPGFVWSVLARSGAEADGQPPSADIVEHKGRQVVVWPLRRAALATHPPEAHAERRPQMSVAAGCAPSTGLPSISVSAPKLAV